MIPVLLIYLAAVNLLTFVLFGVDKYKARHDRWRISEFALLGLSLIGGSPGAWLGMHLWHHKTRHPRFRYGIPLILLLQLLACILYISQCSNDYFQQLFAFLRKFSYLCNR